MIQWPNIGMFGNFELCEEGIIAALNKNFLLLDALVQAKIVDQVAVLPGSPADGEAYILTTNDNIMIWNGLDWVEVVPEAGYMAWINDLNDFYYFNGTDWIIFPKTLGDVVANGTSTDNALVRYDGATGKVIQNSLAILSDAGSLSGLINVISTLVSLDLFSVKQQIVTGITGADQTIPSLTAVNIKVQSNADSIADIADPTPGSYDRMHVLINDRSSGDIIVRNNANIVTGTGADIVIKNKSSIFIIYDNVTSTWNVVNGNYNLPAPGTVGNLLTSNGTVWQSSAPSLSSTPTIQRFTSGSGTYTTPVGVRYIKVTAIGGGGGGGGAGTSSTDGGAGGNTTFGTSLITAGLGGGGSRCTTASGSASGGGSNGGDNKFTGYRSLFYYWCFRTQWANRFFIWRS